MKTLKTIFILATTLPLISLFIANLGIASSAGISWLSFEQGISLVENEQKKLLVNFYADWCTYCKEMDEKTFKDPAVISFINKNFIPIRVDSEKDQKTAKLFRVRGLPDTWFMSETKEIIGHRAGYIPADIMIQVLKYIHSDSYQSMSLKNFIDNN